MLSIFSSIFFIFNDGTFNRSKEYRTVLNTFLAESIYGIKLIKIFNRQKEKQEEKQKEQVF